MPALASVPPRPPTPAEMGQWAEAMRPSLVRLAWHYLRDHARAEDAVQEAITGSLLRLAKLVDREHAVRSLCTTVRNKAIDEARRGWRDGGLTDDLIDTLPDTRLRGNQPDDKLLEDERGAALAAVLARYPAEDVVLLDLRYKQGCDFATIGPRLGISEPAARVRHHRLLARLRDEPELRALDVFHG